MLVEVRGDHAVGGELMARFLEGADDPAAARPYYRLLGLRAEAGEPAGLSKLVIESRA